jgi:hypothetical protein
MGSESVCFSNFNTIKGSKSMCVEPGFGRRSDLGGLLGIRHGKRTGKNISKNYRGDISIKYAKKMVVPVKTNN